jgi:hypothetical protein
MMRIHKFAVAIALGAAAMGLSACATSLNTRVTRYQAMPAPQGQTFYVVPEGQMAGSGGLEFQRYAGIVTQQLQARGYTPATDVNGASMVVQLGYAMDHGQVRYVEDPFGPSGFGYPGYFGANPFFYPRFGYLRSPFYYGWADPLWYGGGVDSYVEYHSELNLHIRAKGTEAPLFDGRAQARSQTDRLEVVLPSLIEAMFTGFPGQNGETVKITIPARPKS